MKRKTKVIAVIVMITSMISAMVITIFADASASSKPTYHKNLNCLSAINITTKYIQEGVNENMQLIITDNAPKYYTTEEGKKNGGYLANSYVPTSSGNFGASFTNTLFSAQAYDNGFMGVLTVGNDITIQDNATGYTSTTNEHHTIEFYYEGFVVKNDYNFCDRATVNVTDLNATYTITQTTKFGRIRNGNYEEFQESQSLDMTGDTLIGVELNVFDFNFESNFTDAPQTIQLSEEYQSDNGEIYVVAHSFKIENKDRSKYSIRNVSMQTAYLNQNEWNAYLNLGTFLNDNKTTEVITIVETVEADFTTWIVSSVQAFTNFQIYPGITLGGIIGIFVAIAIVLALLKYFAGG